MSLDIREFASKVRVVDGAWGTEMQKLGLPAGAPPELWNTERPDAVAIVARAYVEAGAEVLITNTFGANRFVLEQHDVGGRTAELAAAGVRVSKEAAGGAAKVFASLGPTGKIVMMGDVPEDQIAAAFAESARAMADAGADAILLESFAQLDEITLAVQGVRGACELPVVCSMSYGSGPDGLATMMGNSPEDLVALAKEHGVSAVGSNCGTGPETFIHLARRFRAACDLPIWMKPNAGLPQVVNGKTVFPMSAELFGEYAPKIMDAGANLIGGCCGTTPAHIAAVGKALRSS